MSLANSTLKQFLQSCPLTISKIPMALRSTDRMIRKWPRAGKISLFFAVYKTQLWQGEDSPIFRNKSKPATRISLLLVLHNVKPEFLEECSFLGESRVQGLRALRGLCRAHAGVNVTDLQVAD
jgi:hypothetical protein